MSLAVVTGAANGMGRACVERLLGDGWTVVAVDLREPTIDADDRSRVRHRRP